MSRQVSHLAVPTRIKLIMPQDDQLLATLGLNLRTYRERMRWISAPGNDLVDGGRQ